MVKGRRRSYHHGNLRQALIDATLALVEEQGPAAATMATRQVKRVSLAAAWTFPNHKSR